MDKERTGFELSLKKLTIDNFRGFGHLEIPFDKEIMVFIAENGGGKTTILDAIAECLKTFLFQLLKRQFALPSMLSYKNIKYGTGALNAKLDIQFLSSFYEQVFIDGEGNLFTKEEVIEQSIEVTQGEEFEEIRSDYSIYLNLTEKKMNSTINGYESTQESEFDFKRYFDKYSAKTEYCPLLLYYGCNSVNTIADTINDVKEDEIYHIYHGALEPTRFSFQSFFQWFDTQFKLSHIPEKKPNEGLELVCEAIEKMFNDDMGDKNYQNLRMDYHLSGNDMVIDKQNSVGGYDRLDVTQMSSGEKMIFAMVADIAKRLILANPSNNNKIDDKNEYEWNTIKPLEGKGIVLIDEIDLHLHPKWQRKVLVKLKEIFPNLQFIVTTHSPFILQTLKPENIRLLELSNFQVSQFDNAFHFGRDVNAIAYSLQGVSTRIPEIEVEIKKMYELIDETKYDEAKDKINQLSKYLSDFDEDIIKAKTFIEFYSND